MQFVMLASQMFLLPFYVKILGIESYALIGIYMSLQGIFVMFDLGMSTTVNQELAKLLAQKNLKRKALDLLHTFEWVYWLIAFVIFFIAYYSFPFITSNWAVNSSYSSDQLNSNLFLISILIVLRFPISFYTGALNGMQKQYQMNIIAFVLEIIKFGLIVTSILFFYKNIEVFFLANILISFLQIIFLRKIILNNLSIKNYRSKFDYYFIQVNWKFSLGISLISIAAIAVSQSDKLILGKMLSMKEFSYYALGFSIASIPSRIYGSIASAFYPQLVHEKALEREDLLKATYHKSCQFISVLIIPMVVMACVFMPELLNIWFGSGETTAILTPIVRILMIGFALNGFVTMPYYLQLVHRWTKLSIYKNIVAIILLIPTLYFSILKFGIIGACWIWLILNLLYFIFEIPIMHSRIMKDEKMKYYLEDIGKFLIVSLLFTTVIFTATTFFILPIYFLFAILVITGIVQIFLLNKISSENPLGIKLF